MSPIKGIKQDLQRVNKLIDRADELVSERNQIAQGLNAFYAHCWDAGEWVALEDAQEIRDLYLKTSAPVTEAAERLIVLRWNLKLELRVAMMKTEIKDLTPSEVI